MSRRSFASLQVAVFLFATPALAEIRGEDVQYESGDTTFLGYHAFDDATAAERPGVLVVHQWTGLGDYEKRRARDLAALGYNVFAVDIYGKGVRPQPPASGVEAAKYKEDRPLFRKRLQVGLAQLMGDKRTDASKIAALGYCFGGTGALELARSGAPLRGVVSFHGGLSTPTPGDAKRITGAVLVLHGEADPFVPAAEVEAFKQEMAAARADLTFVAYPGAVHAFTQSEAGNDTSKGAAYNAEADKKSWDEMKAFLVRVFE